MKIYIRLESPYEWVRLNGTKVDAFGEVQSLADYPLRDDDDVIGVVSGEWVTSHVISLPAKTRKQFNAALPYALEDAISEDVENTHFVCSSWRADEESTVFVVAKQKMHQWQALANEYQLPLVQLVADYNLIPFHDAADYSMAQVGDQVIVNQVNGLGAKFDLDFIDIWLSDVPLNSMVAVNDKTLTEALIAENAQRDIRHWPFGDKMAHWLEQMPSKQNDLFSDQYRPSMHQGQKKAWALPVGLLLLAILTRFAFDAYSYISLHVENRDINVKMKQVVTSSFPEINVVLPSKERFMMEQALNRKQQGRGPSNLQGLLAGVAKVLKRQNITYRNITYRNKELILSCELDDFSQVDTIVSQLNSIQSVSAKLQSSSADGDKISARYSIKQS